MIFKLFLPDTNDKEYKTMNREISLYRRIYKFTNQYAFF